MLKKNIFTILSIITVSFFIAYSSGAFVVQNMADALTFKNSSHDIVSSNRKEINSLHPSTDAYPIDYDKIADKLLPVDEPEKLYVNMQHKSAQTIIAKPGQTFFVVLPEEEGSSWIFGKKPKISEIISSEHNKNLRILEFRVLNSGEESLFIDNLPLDKGDNKVLQSKIIRLKVKKTNGKKHEREK